MRNRIQLLQAALLTHDPKVLFSLVEEALDVVQFMESKLAFSEMREKKLREMNKRQTAMIDNLEKTLHGR